MSKIIFDTETTGLIAPKINDIKQQPYITEIYCIKIDDDFNIIDTFGTYVKPPISIPEILQKKIGITDAMVADAPTFREIYEGLSEFFLGADTMVAHNVAFDRSMVANELVRADRVLNFPWPIHHVCTVEKSLHIEQRRMNLTSLHKHLFGKEFDNAHSAKADVEALLRCYEELCKND